MKKHIFLLISSLTFCIAQSQDISDALRYSQENLNGTARFRSMSGAFGALGGDMSSLNVNPAGSAIFINNQVAFTLSNYDKRNESNYFGTATTISDNNLDLNQAGGVLVFKNYNPKSDWTKFTIAANFENTNNLDNSLFSKGTNPNNSIDSYFLSYADRVVPLKYLDISSNYFLNRDEQQAFLGYQGYVINPLDESNPENTQYISNVAGGNNFYQENVVYSSGYNGKFSFNFASSYKDKLYLGINLNSHFVDFNQSTIFYESNNSINPDSQITELQLNNDLHTYGNGFSFQLGAIAKLTDEFRLGLAYESPTWYRLNDELIQELTTLSGNSSNNSALTEDYPVYKLKTPAKVTGSLAYVFGKNGLLSLDYTLKDYSNIKLKPEMNSYYMNSNNFINSNLQTAGELRIGGEYRIERLSLRAGFRHEDSPYKDKRTIGDLNSYSTGLGYNFGSTKADLSYSYSKRNSQQGFFNQGFTDGANIDTINNTVSLTLLFEL